MLNTGKTQGQRACADKPPTLQTPLYLGVTSFSDPSPKASQTRTSGKGLAAGAHLARHVPRPRPQLSLTTPGPRAGSPPRWGSPTAPSPPVLPTLRFPGWRVRPPKRGLTGNPEVSQSNAFWWLCQGPRPPGVSSPSAGVPSRAAAPRRSSHATAATGEGTERRRGRSEPPPAGGDPAPTRRAGRPLRRSPPPPPAGGIPAPLPADHVARAPQRRCAGAVPAPPARPSLGLWIKMAAAGAGPGGSGRC